MNRILKRFLCRDFKGKVLSWRIEELVDDGAGLVQESYETSIKRCGACRRPVEKIDEMRGRCITCGRSCCSLCAGACSVCGRGPFCGRCRTGFPEKNLSVCPNCLAALQERLRHQDQLLEKKAAFEHALALYDAQLKLAQLLQHNKGTVSEVAVRLAQLRAARKIAELERAIQKDGDSGRPLLP